MESDEESPLMPSSPVHERKLKRLKKVNKVSEHSSPKFSTEQKPSSPMSSPISYQPEPTHSDDADFQDFEDSEVGSRPGSYGFAEDGGLQNSQPRDSQRNAEKYISHAKIIPDIDSDSHQQIFGDGVTRCMETKTEERIDVTVPGEVERPSEKKKRDLDGISSEKKQNKKKRIDRNGEKPIESSSFNERRAAKERREHYKQLRAESQRLLRETRDVAFKPVPLVEKPISSVLEKIRLRKQQVSIISFKSNVSDCYDGFSKEVNSDNESSPVDERINMVEKDENEETIAFPDYDKDGVGIDELQTGQTTDAADCTKTEIISSHVIPEKAMDTKSVQEFRAPLDDTQDLVSDSQISDAKDELSRDSSHEEAFKPSVLAMNLRLGSAPPDDMLSDEENNDTENAFPHLGGSADLSSSPRGDPVKAFVDEEAEEDDSDNDSNLQENEEDEENDDAEELMDMIATTYEEKPIENERRNQLHQQWLEQQDAAGTENLLQKLKYGSNLRHTSLDEEEDDHEGEDHNEIDNDAEQDLAPSNVARMNLKRAKQMLSQVFTDKDDPYISDDEETESKLAKECLLQRTEERATFLSPAEDKNSREVFGLIKKLNTVQDAKKKTKPASLVDLPFIGQQRIMSSKSSFLHRGSNHSLPSQRNGSSKVRSFIFGRDESISRSSISISVESSVTIDSKSQQTKSSSAKYLSISQNNVSKSTMLSTSSKTGNSLYEILRRPPLREAQTVQNNSVHQGESVFAAFKLTKKSMKSEGKM